jgi:uncharacterized membrane protein YukC
VRMPKSCRFQYAKSHGWSKVSTGSITLKHKKKFLNKITKHTT